MLNLLFLICGLICTAFGDDYDDFRQTAMENPDMFGGDMLGVDPDDRNAVPQQNLRWTGATVPYVIDSSLQQHVNVINAGFQNYHATTCIRFVPRTNQQNYIRLFAGNGCYSNVGMIGGQQQLSLGNGCIYTGTVVHELGHALGLYHEQSRSDRDQYLDIFLNNVQQGMEFNFAKLRPEQNILFTTFDYGSIMIYGNTAFSKDGRSETMRAKNGQKLYNPFDKQGMTPTDITRIKKMYNC